jgi:hypothetical protein
MRTYTTVSLPCCFPSPPSTLFSYSKTELRAFSAFLLDPQATFSPPRPPSSPHLLLFAAPPVLGGDPTPATRNTLGRTLLKRVHHMIL